MSYVSVCLDYIQKLEIEKTNEGNDKFHTQKTEQTEVRVISHANSSFLIASGKRGLFCSLFMLALAAVFDFIYNADRNRRENANPIY